MRENILLVEDEEAMRMVVSDRLQSEGYAVECAADGEIGFRKATSLPFDLMIFDIMLPHRTGLDLCRDVRRVGLRTPILLLSAYQQTVIKTTGFEIGADDYMSKPFDMLELNARIEALLRRRRSSSPSTSLSQPALTQETELLSAKAAGLGRSRPPMNLKENEPEEDVTRRIAGQKDFSRAAEVVPRLRQRLADELQRLQTSQDATWLGVAEGIIQFLEEAFQGRDRRCAAERQKS